MPAAPSATHAGAASVRALTKKRIGNSKLKLLGKKSRASLAIAAATRGPDPPHAPPAPTPSAKVLGAQAATAYTHPQAVVQQRQNQSTVPTGVLPEVGFVRLPTILQVYPISRAGWWKGVKDGTLPAGVLLSARVRAWPVEAIRKLLEEAGKAS